jgi:hypothetical protein
MKEKYINLLLILFILSIIINGYFFSRTYWTSLYDEDDFNCVDMSYGLAPVFRHLGFDTKIIYGSNSDDAHAWLSINGIYFDSTSLWFSDESKYTTISFVDSYPWGYWDEMGLSPVPPHHPIKEN